MRRVAMLCAMGLIGVVMALPAAYAQPQPGGAPGGAGGPGGGDMQARMQMMRAMRAIDTYWSGVSFEVKGIDDAKLAALRPAFQEAWDARKEALKGVAAGGDRAAAAETVKGVNSKLEGTLKQSLTPEQLKQLQAYVDTAGAMGMMGGRPGGGGGGRPGGGGGRPQ